MSAPRMCRSLADFLMTTVEVIPQEAILRWGREQGMDLPPVSADLIPKEQLRRTLLPVYARIAQTYLGQCVLPWEAPDAGVEVSVGEPRVVMLGAPGDRHWGHYMWPTIYAVPGGILVRLIVGEDVPPHFQDNRFVHFFSADGGAHWTHLAADDSERERPLTDIAFRLPDGEEIRYVDRMLDVKDPERATRPFARWAGLGWYRLGDLPADQQTIPMFSRPPGRAEWLGQPARLDPETLLPGRPADRKEGEPGRAAVRLHLPEPYATRNEPYVSEMHALPDGSLLTSYLNARHLRSTAEVGPDGALGDPPAAYLMRSIDRGRTWRLAGTVPFTRLGPFCQCVRAHVEPGFRTGWVALVRSSGIDGSTHGGPLLLSRSADKGASWTPPVAIRPCSVNPVGRMLDNGVAVRAYGRPGAFLTFCADGEGRRWGNDVTLVQPWLDHHGENACCNGNFLVTGPDRFLYVYTQWDHGDPWGQPRVATLVQEFVARPRPRPESRGA